MRAGVYLADNGGVDHHSNFANHRFIFDIAIALVREKISKSPALNFWYN
jgi:hypothetical protein